MRATIYHLYEDIGVCRLADDERVLVGECRVGRKRSVRVLPQTLREPMDVFECDVEIPKLRASDRSRLAVSGIKRFRRRLAEIEMPEKVGRVELRRQARGAIDDLEALLARIDEPA